ncbi:hypothetical protein [Kaistella polysaccharea]|uniref:hypothetical protein n=1 Tax=Kaistella polysaccharea TaxID=2878534 RepID=UPI001CF0E09F|nr:hypothetical protein [Kaistella polysaccharea]
MKTALQSKKWFIFLLTFYSIIVNSQNLPRHQNERTYQEYMDKILDEIIKNDKDIFKNGILYDRVPHLAKLDKFNTGDNISNYNHFLRSWEERYQASIKPDFQNISSINKYALAKEMQGVIVIGAINIEFTTIDSTALSPKKPLMELKNGKLHHIKGNNAYIDNKSLVISALNSSKVDSLNLQFEFGKIFLNNSKNKIKEMVATFEGNQKVNLVKNGKINKEIFRVNFLSPGNKKIKFEATYKDGATNTTYADFLIDTSTQLKEIVSINSQSPIIPVKATKPFQGYDELADCGGNCFGEGEYQIFSSNTKLMKPFIIVDGFDPNDSRKIPDILSQMQYDGTSLHTTLLNQGFDVIVVNFPKYISGTYYYEYYDYDEYGNYVPIGSYIDNYRDGGTDYIERNAKVVESLLNKLNVELSANGSSNKIKIAGPSMGALIVQYALREME